MAPRSLHLSAPHCSTPPHPFSALSHQGHILGAPPDGGTCPCTHLRLSLGPQGLREGLRAQSQGHDGPILFFTLWQALGLWPASHGFLSSPPLDRMEGQGSYLVKSSSASMCLGMGE